MSDNRSQASYRSVRDDPRVLRTRKANAVAALALLAAIALAIAAIAVFS